MKITVRPALPEDAHAVVSVHKDAVHNIASADYEQEILDEWSGPVTQARADKYLNDSADVKLVAEIDGRIVGFGELKMKENLLLACYVSSAAAKRGVGRELLEEMEKIARLNGVKYLEMDSSVTAEPFYTKNGYEVIERGTHTLNSGRSMACVKMRKTL